MSKVKTLGNYSPSEHNASKIVDVDYSASTVRENHGTVTAIIDDTYKNRDKRVYEDASPSLRAGRSGLKVANEIVTAVAQRGRENGQQFELSNREVANALTTVQKDSMVAEKRARQVGDLNYFKHEQSNRIYSSDAACPTLATKGTDDARCIKIEEGANMEDLRIRKLTPTECFRLMGVKDEDSEKLANMSNSTKYHLAGDSIVTTVLMAIFGELLEVEWKGKVNNLHG